MVFAHPTSHLQVQTVPRAALHNTATCKRASDMLVLWQALVEDPPVHPEDVLREIVDLGQLPLQPPYEGGELQEVFDSSESEDSLDGTGLDEDISVENSTEVQDDEQLAVASLQQSGQADAGNAAGWTDDSFTDAALDDSDFDAGFDPIEQGL